MPDPTVLLRAHLLLAIRIPAEARSLGLTGARAFGRAPAAGRQP